MTPSVLIVESCPLMRNKMQALLQSAGYTAHGAANAGEATQLLLGVPVDAVITELDLTPETGLDLIRMIRCDALFKVLPILLHTSFAPTDDLVHQARRLGVTQAFFKAEDEFSQLIALLDDLLRPRRSLHLS